MLIQLLTNKYPGMRLWLSQRLTAVVMAIYIVLLVVLMASMRPVGFEAWSAFVSPVWFKLLTLLFFISLFMHAWLGVSDVFKDYVFNLKLRAILQMIVDILLVVYLVWINFILWNL